MLTLSAHAKFVEPSQARSLRNNANRHREAVNPEFYGLPHYAMNIDLCTVQELADWTTTPSAADGSNQTLTTIYQEAITGWSILFHDLTGRDVGYYTGNGSGDFSSYSEVHDGNGATSMGVLNGPVQSIQLVQVNDVTFQQSTAWNMAGYYIDQNPNFVSLRSGGNGRPHPRGWVFWPGQGNVLLQYQGGYQTVPADVVTATLKACAVILAKRLREDEGSRTIAATGSVSGYRAWKWPPECQQVITKYTRTILNYSGSL